MKLSNTYASLGDAFYQASSPASFENPTLSLWNKDLADELLIPKPLQDDPENLAKYFSGQRLFEGSKPVAAAYAGHQFGHFSPQLGDGRAHLLGDVRDYSGNAQEIQLKGSGQTPFSRGGDGRCAIGPAVREFVMSEAMHAMAVPTTRCLAVVATGEIISRNRDVPGAVVTRIASSHIRVGTFQYFSSRGDVGSLQKLCDYSIARHYPELMKKSGNQAALLCEAVIQKQIALIVEWNRVGFIHGVMNTDNTAISGETIDYGPCAMMGRYHPGTVYSSIDREGRYAFANQAAIVQWNMARFAECLLPLVDENQDEAVKLLLPMIESISNYFEQAYIKMMGQKFGLQAGVQGNELFIDTFLKHMQENKLDYTQTFASLTKSLLAESVDSDLIGKLGCLYTDWKKKISTQELTDLEIHKLMAEKNPVVIARNHHVEAVIKICEQTNDFSAVLSFLKVLRSPYQSLPETKFYQDVAGDGDENYQTFCGT
ncbi:MAG: YdiU family protein [Mariprofundaceae bacterium]